MGPGCENLGRGRFGNEAARSTLAGRVLSEAAPGGRGHPKVGDAPEIGGSQASEPGSIVADNIFGRMAPCCQLTTISGGRAERRVSRLLEPQSHRGSGIKSPGLACWARV